MEFYLFLLIILVATALSDLYVGVANDAVNFVTAAVGSKAGTRVAIMITASIGVFIGTTFSSGMMEVARKGVFNPEMFVFHEVMIIFLAVMLQVNVILMVFNLLPIPPLDGSNIFLPLLPERYWKARAWLELRGPFLLLGLILADRLLGIGILSGLFNFVFGLVEKVM